MLTALAFVIVPVLVLVLRTPLLRAPVLFYLLAVAASVLLVAFPQALQSLPYSSAWADSISRGMVPFALFLVVMYIGVLPESSKLRRYLMPIRGYLSIFAALLACGHFARYLVLLMQRVVAPGAFATARSDVVAVVSVLLTLLLAVLTITSFGRVRDRMGSARWRNVQKWAYVFLGIAYVHVLVMLAPAALRGGDAALRLGLYTLAIALYIVLKVRALRAAKARRS